MSDLLPHLRRARDHADQHVSEPLDVDRLAGVAGVSRYHFTRRFQAAYGETPIRYVNRRRIERAQDLLRSASRGRGLRSSHDYQRFADRRLLPRPGQRA